MILIKLRKIDDSVILRLFTEKRTLHILVY